MSLFNHYKQLLGYDNIPEFLNKYIFDPKLIRLSKIGYFCGMDYASKDIYSFKEKISRYEHSITTALLTWKLTKDKKATVAALYHDISTPCFSHTIDYMNKDYNKQESTEEYTIDILEQDEYLKLCLDEDDIDFDDIKNIKSYSIVDNDRPKLCADRLDGIILTSISWMQNISEKDIDSIINDVTVFTNEDQEYEIGFKTSSVAEMVIELNNKININTHSNYDCYMMELLASITKYAINHEYILYDDLYIYTEDRLFEVLNTIADKDLKIMINKFQTIKQFEIPEIKIEDVKDRSINPLVSGERLENQKSFQY